SILPLRCAKRRTTSQRPSPPDIGSRSGRDMARSTIFMHGGEGVSGETMSERDDRRAELDAGALAVSGHLGKTIQRLRKAYNLSLSELSEQSGVAKSIISQIERNETNPTLATIWRLSQALDIS